jgi:LysR family transcriptional regulator, hydrogen peroxide-inducible genes activator
MADLKLKDLKYLVAIADTRHFGKAAARSFVSQPTLSAQIRKLEEYLGVQLIERQPRHALLTPAGAAVVERARRIAQASDEIVEIARSHRDPLSGRLRIAFLPTIGPYLLPTVAPRIHKALPDLELMLYEYQTEPMLEHLHGGDIDAGVLALPVDLDGLESRELYAEPFVLATPTDHPLARRNSVRAEDLRGHSLLLLEEGHCLRDQALDVCGHVAVAEMQDFRATSLETLRQMVATGAGVTLLPQLATEGAYANARGVAIRTFTRPAPTRQIGLVWRSTTARRAAIDAVAKLMTTR